MKTYQILMHIFPNGARNNFSICPEHFIEQACLELKM